jgi:hypothetical protein
MSRPPPQFISISNHHSQPLCVAKGAPAIICSAEDDDDTDTDEVSSTTSISSMSALTSTHSHATSNLVFASWDRRTLLSDFVREAVQYKGGSSADGVIMVFERPSSLDKNAHFYNHQAFKACEYPAVLTKTTMPQERTILEPLCCCMMNGASYPVFLSCHPLPTYIALLTKHWQDTFEHFFYWTPPRFTGAIHDEDRAYCVGPCESVRHHVNDPFVHFHLSGLDAIHLMAPKHCTLALRASTAERPCVAQVTRTSDNQSRAFVICDDADAARFQDAWRRAEYPNVTVTENVRADCILTGHFFLHLSTTQQQQQHTSSKITWFGTTQVLSNNNNDSKPDCHIVMRQQTAFANTLAPFVRHVAAYCRGLGFFGFIGADVIMAGDDAYLVRTHPRVAPTVPALMVAQLLRRECAVFRQSGQYQDGSAQDFLERVKSYNMNGSSNKGRKCQIVVFSIAELTPRSCLTNVGVYGPSLEKCQEVLDRFTIAHPQTSS